MSPRVARSECERGVGPRCPGFLVAGRPPAGGAPSWGVAAEEAPQAAARDLHGGERDGGDQQHGRGEGRGPAHHWPRRAPRVSTPGIRWCVVCCLPPPPHPPPARFKGETPTPHVDWFAFGLQLTIVSIVDKSNDNLFKKWIHHFVRKCLTSSQEKNKLYFIMIHEPNVQELHF